MKERPILFSAPMVRAIFAGTKTQTRRVAKWKLRESGLVLIGQELGQLKNKYFLGGRDSAGRWNDLTHALACPYGAPGDRLWVRETHAQFAVGEGLDRAVPQCVAYRATCDDDGGFDYVNGRGEIMRLKVTRWTPAIFMPRWASRITLDIVRIRVERLHDISEEDAIAEGVEGRSIEGVLDGKRGEYIVGSARDAFAALWDEINGKPRPMLDDDGEPVLDDNERPIMIAPQSWASNPWVWVVEFRRVDDAPIKDLLDRSSIGAGLKNIRENGIDAELRDLEEETRR